jgi:esterase
LKELTPLEYTQKILETKLEWTKFMQRHFFKSNNLKLSYLDAGGNGAIIIALHAHWMQASGYNKIAAELLPNWRVIALDQRGHGFSEHANSYTREDYLGDLNALFKHLEITEPAILMGNSLGGVNAYQFAAKNPHLVKAMIIEDIGVDISSDVSFSLNWKGVLKTRKELEEKIGPRFLPYLEASIHETKKGFTLMFDVEEMIISEKNLCGNYWDEWLKSDCPCLVIRGEDSRVTTQEESEQMSVRRLNTQLKTIAGSHVLHMDNPIEFTKIVKAFLQEL